MAQLPKFKWRVTEQFPFSWRQWNDQFVVYHPGTGDTHLLDKSTFQILDRIKRDPVTAEALINEFAHLSDNQQDMVSEISDLLVQWELVDLIERVENSDSV